MYKRIISLVMSALCLLSSILITVPVSADSFSIYLENDIYGEINGDAIEMIPQSVTVERFLDNIMGTYGVDIKKELYDASGQTVISEGVITDNMLLKITYDDSVKEFTLKLAPVVTKDDFGNYSETALIYPGLNKIAEGIPVRNVVCIEGRVTMTEYQNLHVSLAMQDDMWTYPIRFRDDGTISQFLMDGSAVQIPYELNKPYQFVVLMDLPKKRSWLYLNGMLVSKDKEQGDYSERMWDGKKIANIYLPKKMDYFKYYSVESVEDFDIEPFLCNVTSSNRNVIVDKSAGIVQIKDDSITTRKDLFDSLQFANEEERSRVVLRNRIGVEIVRDTALLRNTMYLDVTSPNGLATSQYAISGVNEVKADAYQQSDYDKFGLLKSIGIFEAGDTLNTSGVSRMEFAKYLVTMTDSLATESSMTASFSDVDASNTFAPYIYSANAQGYMSGRGDGTFGAADRITYNEAITALVRVAGYEPLAQAKGGYPAGYCAVANSIGILRNPSIDGSSTVSKLEIVSLLYNTLMTPYIEVTTISNDTVEYAKNKDVTVLEVFHNLKKATGRVTANSFTHLYEADKKMAAGRITIDEVPYKVPENSDYESYLGMEVDFYYINDESSVGSIIYMNKRSDVEALTLQADSIASVSGNELLYYNKEGDLKKVALAGGFSYLYNGRIDAGRTVNDLLIADGELTFIDGRGTGQYDIVIARVPELFLFEGSNEGSGTIYAGGEVIETDVDSSSLKLVDKFGAVTPITLKDIPYPSVLTVYRSKDSECIEIYVSTTTKEDTLVEKSEDYLIVGDVQLTMVPGFDANALEFKETYLFRLDALGRIAFCEVSKPANRYGYLIGVAGAQGLDGKAQLRVVVGDSEYVDYTVAEKVMLNERQVNSTEVLVNGAIEPQLIKYVVNKNNEVTNITTNLVGETVSGRYINSGGMETFSGRIVLSGSTFTLDVPTVAEEITNHKLYSRPLFQNEQTYDIMVYDLDADSYVPGAILRYASGSLAGSSNLAMNASVGIVKSMKRAVDIKGTVLYALELVGTSGAQEYYLSEEHFSEAPDLKFGDCIRYSLNSKGDTILNLVREFRVDSNGENYSVTPALASSSYSLRYGKILNKYYNYVTMDDINNSTSCVLTVLAGKSFRVDFKNETIIQTTITDMLPNVTGVFSRGSSTYPPNLIIEYMFDD